MAKHDPFDADPLRDDVPANHHEMWAHAVCYTCGETYPGSTEHGIRWDEDYGMFVTWDATHGAAWQM